MRQALRVAAGITGALLLLLIGAFAWGRLRPPTPAQAEALKLLQMPAAPAGANAWPVLWLLDYDIPADQLAVAYARERAQLQAWLARPEPHDMDSYPWLAAQNFAKRPPLSADDNALLCQPRSDDCLAKAREHAAPLRALLTRQAARLAALQGLAADAVLWDDLPIHIATPFPAFGAAMKLQLSAPALAFTEGQPAQALAALCQQATSVRRLHAHTNSLVGAMVGVAWMDGIERELAGMLAALPADQAVPAACAQAFAPVAPRDVDLCAPMQREYAVSNTALAVADPARQPDWLRRAGMWSLFSPALTQRLAAPSYAHACQAEVRAAQLADRALPLPPPLRYDLVDRVTNIIGVILAQIAGPAYDQYAIRNQDYAAGLRLTAWLLAHRADTHGAAAWQQRLQQALPSLQQGGDRQFSVDPDGRHVRMQRRAKHHGTPLLLPLAP